MGSLKNAGMLDSKWRKVGSPHFQLLEAYVMCSSAYFYGSQQFNGLFKSTHDCKTYILEGKHLCWCIRDILQIHAYTNIIPHAEHGLKWV